MMVRNFRLIAMLAAGTWLAALPLAPSDPDWKQEFERRGGRRRGSDSRHRGGVEQEVAQPAGRLPPRRIDRDFGEPLQLSVPRTLIVVGLVSIFFHRPCSAGKEDAPA